MEKTVKNFLVQSVVTEVGKQWTLNKNISQVWKQLLPNYHVEEIWWRYKLVNIIRPPQKDETCKKETETPLRRDVIRVYIDKFCEVIESNKNKSLEQEIAERLGYGQLFKNYKRRFDGKDQRHQKCVKEVESLFKAMVK